MYTALDNLLFYMTKNYIDPNFIYNACIIPDKTFFFNSNAWKLISYSIEYRFFGKNRMQYHWTNYLPFFLIKPMKRLFINVACCISYIVVFSPRYNGMLSALAPKIVKTK